MGKRSKVVGNLQPKGKPLYEQEKSSFGSRMLAKMGWEEGKGLGAKLQGNPEFVRVKYKSDADGFGYEDRNDQWTKNEDGFNKLLSSLNQQTDADDASRAINSLEEKSKQSRVRVHYHKRIACKDLSKRSAKDLANIFGKKSLVDEPEPEVQKVSQESTDSNEAANIYESNTIKATISSVDYFKSKYQNKKMKTVENVEESNSSPEETENRAHFKQASDEEVTPVEQKKEKKSKKKRKASVEDAEASEPVEAPPKEKKSKKRKTEMATEEAEVAAEPKSKSKKSAVSKSTICSNAAYTNDDVEQTVISVDRFAVDKLNFLDLETFGHSNVANIIGYGLTENLNINLLNCQTLQNAKCNKYELYYLMDRKMSQKNINFKMKAKKAVFVPI